MIFVDCGFEFAKGFDLTMLSITAPKTSRKWNNWGYKGTEPHELYNDYVLTAKPRNQLTILHDILYALGGSYWFSTLVASSK